ncbi:LytR C-terminal domain-containing protein [Candidatus Gottesmanbacteria bacterium]|nr:LytR C-terminal domain-containing protein [Candidatus Gottesmanbacteria bacterium]
MDKRRKRQHFGVRFRLLLAFIPVFLIVAGAFFWFRSMQDIGNRMTVVIAADPAVVLSWDSQNNTFTILSLRSDMTIEAVHGYGQYSLESLWKLGVLEGKAGTVLAESVEELLAVPVREYIGARSHALLEKKDPVAMVKEIFSPRSILAFLRGTYATNISPISFWSLSWAISQTRPENIRTIDLSTSVGELSLPDGSLVYVADVNRMDQKIGDRFEDEAIRKEALSVAVFNTTPVSSLGTRVARLMGHVGILVITVGNDRPLVASCTMSGEKKALESQTAQMVRELFSGCEEKEPTERDRADLTVRIGTTYQARFLPFRPAP